MNLPNYFFADLPTGSPLGSAMLTEACHTLRRNRGQFLADRSTEDMIGLLVALAADWQKENFPFRQLALQQGPEVLGFSPEVIARGLESFFRSFTVQNLHALLEQDLGHVQRLERLTAVAVEERTNRAAVATPPELLAHIIAGNIPNAGLHSMACGLLLRAAQFVKCATGASLLPRLFAHSLHEREPKLASCIEVAEWRGGNKALEAALFEQADCVTATGSDDALQAISQAVPFHTRLVFYGHRVSFAYVASAALTSATYRKVAALAAKDITAWDQLGCLSPHVLYVENGSLISAEHFAEALAEELARLETVEPRGKLSAGESAAISQRRAIYELRAAHAPDTRCWTSQNSTAWTVVFEAEALFQASCLHRFVYVKTVANLTDALHAADNVRGKVSTVGLAVPEEKAAPLVAELARWGVTRVCPLGRMQEPPLLWRHDGRPVLNELVTWTDWEMED